jgi:hypothetical protein
MPVERGQSCCLAAIVHGKLMSKSWKAILEQPASAVASSMERRCRHRICNRQSEGQREEEAMSLTRTINMRPTLITLLLTTLLFASLSALHAAEPPLSVLLITADDLGYEMVGNVDSMLINGGQSGAHAAEPSG